MIDKEFGAYYLICDLCYEAEESGYDSYHDAKRAKKEYEWVTKKSEGKFIDICPVCYERTGGKL